MSTGTATARVKLWGRTIAAVLQEDRHPTAIFEYVPEFARSGIEVSPLVLPLRTGPIEFPALSKATFHGLPGLLADSLPDRYGNALIDAWLVSQGRPPGSFSIIERLCYVGSRGMGALEFEPDEGPKGAARPLEIPALVALASDVLSARATLSASLDLTDREAALLDILRVGTSAGGARAKAVIAWNPATQEVRSGQVSAGSGFESWLLKFDGVAENRDRELADPQGFGVIEYAYSHLARAAGIVMMDCRLLEENGRRHFMTRRFDRLESGAKLHAQTLGALAHLDFNQAGAHSYEQAFDVIRRLGLPMASLEEQFRRMVFNFVARNQDDHVKNIAFLMDKSGSWSLSPAYDLTFAYNPEGDWTSRHQMSLNGKRDGFTREDLRACGKLISMKRGRADAILDEVLESVRRWPEFAEAAGVEQTWIRQIEGCHRLEWPNRA